MIKKIIYVFLFCVIAHNLNAASYTVTFSSNGGSEVQSVSVNYLESAGQPEDPQKQGFTFVGWFKDLDLTNMWDFSVDVISNDTTLYAKWERNKYMVTYGTTDGAAISIVETEFGSNLKIPNAPLKDGYTFAGWYKEPEFISNWRFDFDTITDNTQLYAKWDINSYTVSFETFGGTGVEVLNVQYLSKIVQPSECLKTGYTLLGWFTDTLYNHEWKFESNIILRDTILYAKWVANSYSISFECNGGSLIREKEVFFNTKITISDKTQKTGYSFAGWFKEPELASIWDFETDVISGNTMLYAKWVIKQYSIKYESNGGSATNDTIVENNSKVTKPINPSKYGYSFKGWFKEKELYNLWVFEVDTISKDTVLYAKWEVKNYRITFESNGGTAVSDLVIEYNTKIICPNAPKREGYTFTGWYKDSQYDTPWNFDIDVVNENTLLYAKWQINYFTISFESNGGTNIEDQHVPFNTKIVMPLVPKKEGFIFDGWFKEPACINSWNFDNDVVTENYVLYAKWRLFDKINSGKLQSIKLYPNPANNFINIRGKQLKNIVISTISGVILENQEVINNKAIFDISWYKSGAYFALITDTYGNSEIQTFIK